MVPSKPSLERLEDRRLLSGFSDGFEGPTIDPFWRVQTQSGSVSLTTARAHSGNQSLQFSSTDTGLNKNLSLIHDFPSATYGQASVWIYDTGAGQTSCNYIELSVNNGASFNAGLVAFDYGFRGNGPGYGDQYNYEATVGTLPTGIARTLAWHQYKVVDTPQALTLLVDGVTVYTTAGGTPFNQIVLWGGGPYWRPAWTWNYDDFQFDQGQQSTVGLVSQTNPSAFGQPVTFTATVTGTSGTPTGNVTFFDGTTNLGTQNLNASGQATLTVSAPGVGNHSITATYNGDANFLGSTSAALTEQVQKAATGTALSLSSLPSVSGQPVTFTATVAVTPPGAGTPTGSVSFLDGTTVLGAGTVAGGQASLTVSTLVAGNHSFSATYGGDTNFQASTSPPITQGGNLAASSVAVDSSPNPSVFSHSVALTATVTAAPGAGVPTGSITFFDGATSLGTQQLNANAQAVLSVSALAVGDHSIKATYSGDSSFLSNTSLAVTQRVTADVATTTTRTWSGGGGANRNWSEAANWKEYLVPAEDNDLVFPDDAQTFFPNNDLAPGMRFHSIIFSGSIRAYALTGNALTLTGGITSAGGSHSVGFTGIMLAANQTFDAGPVSFTITSPINLGTFTLTLNGSAIPGPYGQPVPGNDMISGVVTGNGAIYKSGTSNWLLSGVNNYTGVTTVADGTSGSLIINKNTSLGSPVAGTIVQAGGLLQVTSSLNLAEPLVISGQGNSTSAGAIHVNDTNGTDTFQSIALAAASQILFDATSANTTINLGSVQTNNFNLKIDGSLSDTILLAGAISGPGSTVTVNSIKFGGSGSVDGSLIVNSGILLPGTDITVGTLTIGSVTFNAGAHYRVNIDPSGASRIDVTGTGSVDLTGSSLDGSLLNGFVPAPGQSYVIVQSTGAINGHFQGLPDGSTVTINGHTFVVHYVGPGSGHFAPSSQVILAIVPLPSSTTLTVSPTAALVGQPITFTATVSSAIGSPSSGTVSLLEVSVKGPVVLAAGSVSNGTASFTIMNLVAASHNIVAQFSGNSNLAGSTSDAVPVQINAIWKPLPSRVFVTAADAGGGPDVRIYDASGHVVLDEFFPFASNFTGGVRVAVGDVDGDRVPDIICAAGPGGGPQVKVVNGQDGSTFRSFFAFNINFTGGVYVAAGDVNGDGFADIIVGAAAGGGPNVLVSSGKDGAPLLTFFPYNTGFTGGVRVAAGDVTGDGRADIVTGAGPGGGPNVTVYQFTDALPHYQVLQSYFAFDLHVSAGLFVGAGDVDGDGHADVIGGTDALGVADTPFVSKPSAAVFSGTTAQPLASYPAFRLDPSYLGAVRVAATDLTGGGTASVITVEGPDGSPNVNILDGLTGQLLDKFFAFDPNFQGGVYLANSGQ